MRLRKRCPTLCALLVGASMFPAVVTAQASTDVKERVREYRTAHDNQIVRELSQFLAIRNLASDSIGIRQNADHLMGMMRARGITARRLQSPAGGPPVVYGELASPGATKTVVFYAHYDGQPVDTTQWTSPPWQPVLLDKPLESGGHPIQVPDESGSVRGEWRLYARSASDDKAP